MTRLNIAFVVTHPIQYYSPWFKHISEKSDVSVLYAHRQTPEGQSRAGFATKFEWDLPLLEGYNYTFMENKSKNPSLYGFFGCDTPEVSDLIISGNYDAVVMVGWNKKCFWQAGYASLRSRTPLFIRLDSHLGTPRSWWKQLLKRCVYPLLLPWVANYLSPGIRSDEYLRHYGVSEDRVHRLPHMVDTDRFSTAAAAARGTGATGALRETHGVAPEQFVFLFVGKLTREKRPLLILEAMNALRNDHRLEPALWLVGDGPLDGELAAAIAEMNLPAKQLGFVNQSALPAIYAASDCLILPSIETWGLVVNEAQAAGLPAIVSEEAGCASDLIVDGVTGWRLRSSSARELSGVMARAMSEARELPREPIRQLSEEGSYAVGTAELLGLVQRAKDSSKHVGGVV